MLFAGSAWAQTTVTPPVVTLLPNEFYLYHISANGKWGCGNFVDYGNTNYGFRVNFESGEWEFLDPSSNSSASGISNDGVVVGSFTDNTYRSNGAAVQMAGYWKDGKWNRLEMPSDKVNSAKAADITPDGKYIAGEVNYKGDWNSDMEGIVWENGKISRTFDGQDDAEFDWVKPSGISPDGKYVTGWSWTANRTVTLWGEDGLPTYLPKQVAHTDASGQKFTSDGKYLLFSGNTYIHKDDNHWSIDCIYDMNTKEIKRVHGEPDDELPTVFDLSDNLTAMAAAGERAYIYNANEGKGQFADEYLENLGVDLDKYRVLILEDVSDYRQLWRSSAISADDNVKAFFYYTSDEGVEPTTQMWARTMVVKENQPSDGVRPATASANQLPGLSAVKVVWKPNVAAVGIKGYNVYRDGEKVNAELLNGESYIDSNVKDGDHKYTVTAEYASGESEKSDEAAVTVSTNTMSAPAALYAKQQGYNAGRIEWNAPTSNYGTLTYFNPETANVQSFGVAQQVPGYETAIKFDQSTLSAYKGMKLKTVAFYPYEEQGGWTVNVYTKDASGKLKTLCSQPVTQKLNLGTRNVVTLDNPVDVPTEGDLYIGVAVNIKSVSMTINGMDYGKATYGSSDLVRLLTDADFMSLGETNLQRDYVWNASWAIDATIVPDDADMSKDEVKNYKVYADGKLAGTTENTSYVLPDLADGSHTLGVSAVYADGTESPVSNTTLDITANSDKLVGVEHVSVDMASNSSINATWQAPVDHDNNHIQYCADNTKAITGVDPSQVNNAMCAAVSISGNMIRGLDGYQITGFRFYPVGNAAYTAMLSVDGIQVAEQEIEDYDLNKWNYIALDEPITVNSKSTYEFIIDCYDVPAGDLTVGLDQSMPTVSSYGNLLSTNGGQSWQPLNYDSSEGNWMMGLVMENPNAVALPVAGYDVNIDGEKKNAEMLTANTFSYDFGSEDNKEHTIQVNTYYNAKAETVKGGITRFVVSTTGIADNAIERVAIRQGNNELTVSGNNVKSIELFNAAGASVAAAKGSVLSLNGIEAGVYVVKAVVDGENVTRKISVEK